MFILHPQLAADCEVLGDLALNRVLLNRDGLYPWIILVPKREDVQEIYQLSHQDQQLFWQESNLISLWMQTFFNADKMNVAALGNMVPQLHVHHIARFKDDKAWPKPVWGVHPAEHYSDETLNALLQEMRYQLTKLSKNFSEI